jgi:filamentous hemagglutinin family protein
MPVDRCCRGTAASALVVVLGLAGPLQAQIATDGSVGPAVDLAGPDYVIPADLGLQSGGNLFHSFDTFGVASGESATFTDTGAVAPIDRVLGRVTGGSPSEIDGFLRSEIPGADLYLLNPSGVIFGPDARLDVQGSFHTSTADELRFPNGERFETHAGGDVPLLAVAAPEAFGFLSSEPASIDVDGSFLQVPDGETISLVGGDLTLEASRTLQANTGRIDLVAVGSPGSVRLGQGGDAPHLEGFSTLGDIRLTDGSISTAGPSGGGRIFLRGGDIVLRDADVLSARFHDAGVAGSVDIAAEGLLHLTDSMAAAGTHGTVEGDAGRIDVRAHELRIDLEDRDRSGFDVRSFSAGRAGTIDVEAERIEIGPRRGGVHAFDASTFATGPGGGEITVRADVLEMRDNTIGAVSGRFASGDAGHIDIQAREIRLDGSSRIDASSVRDVGSGVPSRGDAGRIDVAAQSIVLGTGNPSLRVSTGGSGQAGEIHIATDTLEMRNGSFLEAVAFGGSTGDAGSIHVEAERISIQGAGGFTGMNVATVGTGRGGEIHLAADVIDIDSGYLGVGAGGGSTGDAGSISLVAPDVQLTANHTDTTLEARTFGTGAGGRIDVTGEHLALGGGAARVLVDATTFGPGRAGEIHLRGETLEITSRSFVGAIALGGTTGDAGRVVIEGGDIALDASEVLASTFGAGAAGEVHITADTLVAERSFIASLAEGDLTGDAGSVALEADRLQVRESLVNVNSFGVGAAGTIDLRARDLSISQSFVDAAGFDSGPSGRVHVEAETLRVEGSGVFANSVGSGPAGSVEVLAGDVTVVDSEIEASSFAGGDAGSVSIRADRIALREAGEVRARTGAGGNAGHVTLHATESIEISGQNADGDNSDVQTTVRGTGDAGTIELVAPDILLDDQALVASAHVPGTGEPGEVRIVADRLEIRGGALVSTSSLGAAPGAIAIRAEESVRISNAGGDPLSRPRLETERRPGPSGVFSATVHGTGAGGSVSIDAPLVQIVDGGMVATSTLDRADAGSVSLVADRVEIRDGGVVDSSSAGSGSAGTVSIQATESILVAGADDSGVPSRVRSSATAAGAGGDVLLAAPEVVIEGGAVATTTVGESGTGAGGAIEIRADRLRIEEGGRVDSGTFSLADGGRIILDAGEGLEIRGTGSGVFAETGGPGAGGHVVVTAGSVRIEDGGLVSSRSGSGVGGAALVFADAVAGGFVPALTAPPTDTPGDAGNVALSAGSLTLFGGGIDTKADVGDGGNIELRVAGLVTLQDASLNAGVRSGNGGNITIDPPAVVLDRSQIVAQAGAGAGGNIAIRTDLLIASPDSLISASSNLGIDGTVEINAPDVDLAGSLVALPETPLDAAGLLRERCAAQRSDELGSFVVRGREAVPASYAEGLMLALVPPTAASATSTSTTGSGSKDLRLAAALPVEASCPTVTASSD